MSTSFLLNINFVFRLFIRSYSKQKHVGEINEVIAINRQIRE